MLLGRDARSHRAMARVAFVVQTLVTAGFVAETIAKTALQGTALSARQYGIPMLLYYILPFFAAMPWCLSVVVSRRIRKLFDASDDPRPWFIETQFVPAGVHDVRCAPDRSRALVIGHVAGPAPTAIRAAIAPTCAPGADLARYRLSSHDRRRGLLPATSHVRRAAHRPPLHHRWCRAIHWQRETWTRGAWTTEYARHQ